MYVRGVEDAAPYGLTNPGLQRSQPLQPGPEADGSRGGQAVETDQVGAALRVDPLHGARSENRVADPGSGEK